MSSPVLRGTNTSSSGSFPLPTGTTVGDVTIVLVVLAGSSTGNVISAPTGWTTIALFQAFAVFYRVYQLGDTSTPLFGSTSGSAATLAGISYSNVDTTNPVDAYNSCFYNNIGITIPPFNAPSVHPHYAGDTLLCMYAPDGSSSRSAPTTTPSGLTSRISYLSGPCAWVGDKSLTDGTPTGNNQLYWSTGTDSHFGISIAVKGLAATATTVAPDETTIAGACYLNNNGSGTVNYDFGILKPIQNDLVVIYTVGGSSSSGTPTMPAGWSNTTKNTSVLFSKVWNTGDSTNPTVTFPTFTTSQLLYVLTRKCGNLSTDTISRGNIATNDNGSSGTSITSPTVIPYNTRDFLLCFVGDGVNTGTTWTPSGGLDTSLTTGIGPSTMFGTMSPSANPSGTFVTSQSNSGRLLTGITTTVALGSNSVCLWSTTDKGSNAVIDSTQLILTPVANNIISGVRATVSYTTGLYYFEVTFNGIDAQSFSNMGVGISTATADISPTSNSVGLAQLYLYGGVYINNVDNGRQFGGSGGGSQFVAGDIIGVAVNFNTQKIFFSRNGTYGGSMNPVTGAGGLSFSALTGALSPVGVIQYTGDQMTANFGATLFNTALPTGYTAWNGNAQPVNPSTAKLFLCIVT